MHSKQRVKLAINHQEPDRVPRHINATKWVVSKLKKTLNVTTDKELLKALHIDIYDMRGIDIHSGTVPKYIGPRNEAFDGWKGGLCSFWNLKEYETFTSAGWLMEFGIPPLANAVSIEECEKYPWPENNWFDYSNMRSELEDWSDFSLMASGCSIFQHATYIRGMDTLMVDMMAYPEMAHYILDKVFSFYYKYYERMFEEVGDLITIFALADDFGMQSNLLISPELFDEFVAPKLNDMVELAHKYDIKLLLHTCGNVESLIPRLIELSVDILDPIQPECMNPLKIKEQFGRFITLRGGVSVQNVVSCGTVNEVNAETRRIVEALKKYGGYIFSPGHPVLQDDIPVENILAMYETGYKYGFY